MTKTKKETKILLSIFIIAFVIRGLFVFSCPIKWWDETVYANLGYDLSGNPFDYSVKNNGWSDFIPSGGNSFYAWPKMGFRAPLLPYILSIFYLFNIDFLISFLVIFIGSLSIVLLYTLGKKLFNKKIALYSSIFFLLTPLHIIYSAKILAGVLFTFFILLTFMSFWEGYEKGNKKHKIFFGIFLGLSLLARYTALWITPVFFFYFLVKYKSLRFLKEKYIWYSILAFFLILIPWFIYGTIEYSNPVGAFIHGARASTYWGGLQSWSFFFEHWWQMFSATGLFFVFGLIYILYKKQFLKKEIYLLLIWFALFLGIAICMPHKEDRFILAIVPVIALISGFFLDKTQKYRKIILIFMIIISLLSLSLHFYTTYKNSYTSTNLCFLQGNIFLKNINEDILVITDESPSIYYYAKKETHFYPNPWNLSSLKSLVENSYNKTAYVFFTDFDMPLSQEKNKKIKKDLDKFERVFQCKNKTIIYKYI